MLKSINPESILFVDIVTVPVSPEYASMPESLQKLWEKKSSYFRKEDETAADVYQRAGIYAEFGKVICISAGVITAKDDGRWFRIKSFYGDDEKKILTEFAEMLNKFSRKQDFQLCAHNGKEFDFPYIARRMLVNGITLPDVLDVAGKKPWEVMFVDTMELWKFGDYKHFTSLELLSVLFDIPTPKDDIDGSMVAEVYWKEQDLERIVKYCEKDVLAVAQLFLRYKGEEMIAPEKTEKAV